MRAAVEPVRAEDDGGAQAYALLVLELTDAVVAIVCGVLCHARSLGGSLLRLCSHIDEYRSIAQLAWSLVQSKSIEHVFVYSGTCRVDGCGGVGARWMGRDLPAGGVLAWRARRNASADGALTWRTIRNAPAKALFDVRLVRDCARLSRKWPPWI